MQTIWKFPLEYLDEQSVQMPAGANILTTALQDLGFGAMPFIWAEVDTELPTEMIVIYMRGTGHKMTGAEGRYIGTVYPEPLVFHIYERK